MAILPALIADLVLNYLPAKTKISTKKSELIAGSIIGSVFYMFSFPMIAWVFSIPVGMNFVGMEGIEAIVNLTSDFQNSFISILSITAVPGAIMGILGAAVTLDKVYSPPKSIRAENRGIDNNANMGVSYFAGK
jgi:hypothetical protein